MPANFMVRSQSPTIFLSPSCSGPGFGGSWARAAGTARARVRANAQNQRIVFISALREEGGELLLPLVGDREARLLGVAHVHVEDDVVVVLERGHRLEL